LHGVAFDSRCHPTPGLDRADDGLAAGVDVNVLDADLLLITRRAAEKR